MSAAPLPSLFYAVRPSPYVGPMRRAFLPSTAITGTANLEAAARLAAVRRLVPESAARIDIADFFLNPVAEELFSVITESSLLLLSAIMIVPKLNFPPFSLPFRIYGVKCTFKR